MAHHHQKLVTMRSIEVENDYKDDYNFRTRG
jgi:hypothetical protein